LCREEASLVCSIVREYPGAVLRSSTGHFGRQLISFDLWNYTDDPWIAEMLPTVLPGQARLYHQSRQGRGTLHEAFFSAVQRVTVYVSALAIVLLFALCRRLRASGLGALTAIVLFVLVANAAVTGTLSNVEDRYQSRVIWLLPLLAGLLALKWAQNRTAPRKIAA
jgi:hypothetical protein